MTEDIYKGIDGERVKLEGDELAEYLANEAAAAKKESDEAKAQKAAAEAKAALLTKLGITAEEAALLLS
jgi:sorbitol-specific phosphotransferase system component IIBC